MITLDDKPGNEPDPDQPQDIEPPIWERLEPTAIVYFLALFMVFVGAVIASALPIWLWAIFNTSEAVNWALFATGATVTIASGISSRVIYSFIPRVSDRYGASPYYLKKEYRK